MSSDLRRWLFGMPGATTVPLFDTDDSLIVRTHLRHGTTGRRLLRRHARMEECVVGVVSEGLRTPSWEGLLYVMGWGEGERFRPLYVGMAGRKGKKHPISANLLRLESDRGKFARWGDGLEYHIGDLSHALFRAPHERESKSKYEAWAEMLFADRGALRLREPVHLVLVPWYAGSRGPRGEHVSLERAEAEAIDLALEEFEDIVLNVVGETWFRQAASPRVRVPSGLPRRPVHLVTSEGELGALSDRLQTHAFVGLDVETEPYTQRLCLIQLATEESTAVVDALRIRRLGVLGGLLESNVIKVIHNASFERRILGEIGLRLRHVFDTLQASRTLYGREKRHHLAAVCARELGIALDKSQQLSHWHSRPLSSAQIAYAAADAEVLVELFRILQGRLPQQILAFDPPE